MDITSIDAAHGWRKNVAFQDEWIPPQHLDYIYLIIKLPLISNL